MNYHLVCTQPFGNYAKGQLITDEAEVLKLLDDREHHFVRIPVPVEAEQPVEPAERTSYPDRITAKSDK
jgi:hypothetical protein